MPGSLFDPDVVGAVAAAVLRRGLGLLGCRRLSGGSGGSAFDGASGFSGDG
jgi:hypothetical protein